MFKTVDSDDCFGGSHSMCSGYINDVSFTKCLCTCHEEAADHA